MIETSPWRLQWCRGEDSNLRPAHYENTMTLSLHEAGERNQRLGTAAIGIRSCKIGLRRGGSVTDPVTCWQCLGRQLANRQHRGRPAGRREHEALRCPMTRTALLVAFLFAGHAIGEEPMDE